MRLLSVTLIACLAPTPAFAQSIPEIPWTVHDTLRPRPAAVDTRSEVPSDALTLFDGSSLAAWRGADGGAARWKIVDGAMEVVPGTGAIRTAESFGDVQLHIEWMSPPSGQRGQDDGNSGVFLMSRYELQVLNSAGNDTYPDGQAGAIYGQYPPLVNASRPAGSWQTYDVVFRAPRFGRDGTLHAPATMTVLFNGVLVQDHAILTGPTAHRARPPYRYHDRELPLLLQDHEHPVRFRNIWVRRLD